MNRYAQLLELIKSVKPQTIIEIGTWNGLRAVLMAEEALKHSETVHYTGYDLFEDATPETDERELNVKPHVSYGDVSALLMEYSQKHPGFTFELVKGDTRQVLPEMKADFVFIDGGHSVETVRSDFGRVQGSKMIVLDDFYSKDEMGRKPDTTKFGCNRVLEEINHTIMPVRDRVKDGGFVQLAVIGQMKTQKKLIIQTKNCVPHKNVQANILYSTKMNEKWVPECNPHDALAVIVSGGPSVKRHLDDLRKYQQEGAYIACVKHSHDILIEAGIIPWACLLLDPRSHVKEFIENPHKDVRYFCASMCHPSTWDRLLESGAQVFGYHAVVGAGEHEVLPHKSMLIQGGSTSAMRGVSLFYALGFRKFKMVAFDSCYEGDPKTEKAIQIIIAPNGDFITWQDGGIFPEGGRLFWTDPELLAQAQDFKSLVSLQQIPELEVIGDGIVPHLYTLMNASKKDFRTEFVDGPPRTD